jgi:serpin B
MKRLGELLGALLVCVTLLAMESCSEDDLAGPYGDKTTDTLTVLEGRIADNNELAFKMYGLLDDSDNNLLISPHSVVIALGMVYAGAKNNTHAEMADALCFDHRQDVFHASLKALNDQMVTDESSVTKLVIANGFWGRTGLTYLDSYLDILADYYDSEIEPMDFANHPEESRVAINLWISDQTRGFISELLQPGLVHPLTLFVLANTIYFEAKWSNQFDPENTELEAFKKLDGTESLVSMMHDGKALPFYAGNGYRAVLMPYKGHEFSMVLILPDEGKFEQLERELDPVLIGAIVNGFESASVTMSVPKFSFRSKFDLENLLKSLGVQEAFTTEADFSGMDGIDDGVPFLDFVVHETFISVHEFGTTAAAATAAGGAGTSVLPPAEFHAKRPFIFAIRHNATGTILFLGRVLDPEN